MHGITLLLIAIIGVDVGWKPVENGELEYIIQIAPEQLRSLKQVMSLRSESDPCSDPCDAIALSLAPIRYPGRLADQNNAKNNNRGTRFNRDGPPQTVSNDASLLKIPDPSGVDPQSLDHSVIVAPQNENKVSDDSRWVGATTSRFTAIANHTNATNPTPC